MKQWLLIAIVSKQKSAPSISEIARITGTSKQNVKKMALLLEKRGFVALGKDESDARITRVKLTKKCDRYFQNRAGIEDEFMARLFDGIDEQMLSGLYMGFLSLSHNTEEMENIYRDTKTK
jgi:DNA-binding MarR family transcriptional regulator